MKIQSLSIVVPNKECANKCPFCVSRMVNSNKYPNRMDINDPHYDINVREYLKRMKYVANLGCNTVMLTGTSEPQQNKQFLATFALLHQNIGSPFANIEMQTTGLFLNGNRDYVRFLRNFVGINTIALSVNSIDDDVNNSILGHQFAESRPIKLAELCDMLKDYDFNIRVCYNLNDAFDKYTVNQVMDKAKNDYHADQVTLRKLWTSDKMTPQGKWISEHSINVKTMDDYSVINLSKFLGYTEYGAPMRDWNGMSVVYDDDCMGKKPTTDVLKYLILRPNCHLYSSWDTEASIVC